MKPAQIDLQPAQVTVRHIKLRTTGAAQSGEVTVLGRQMAPQREVGINGLDGWTQASYLRRRDDDGEFTLTLPNRIGGDGVEHLRRFLITNPDVEYETGDEWLEFYESRAGVRRLLFVGTPTSWVTSDSDIKLTGVDAGAVSADFRETAAGFWVNSPRDVFEHYTSTWSPLVATDFTGSTISAGLTPISFAPFVARQAQATGGRVRLTAPADNDNAYLQHDTNSPLTVGPRRHWRFEVAFSFDRAAAVNYEIGIGIAPAIGQLDSDVLPSLRINQGVTPETYQVRIKPTAANTRTITIASRPAAELMAMNVVIEGRGRWVWVYINGDLVGVDKQYQGADTPGLPYAGFDAGPAADTGAAMVIDTWLTRTVAPWLSDPADPGDYRLPGIPSAGGLVAEYYDDSDLDNAGTQALDLCLNPTRKPFARRLEPVVAGAAPPAGTSANRIYSTRMTGAIWLPLSQGTVLMSIAVSAGRARVWIGKTRMGEALLNNWDSFSGSLTAATGAIDGKDGWYPIVIEEIRGGGPAADIGTLSVRPNVTYVDPGGTTVQAGALRTVPTTSLAPYGIYQAAVRNDSFSEQRKTLLEQFGIQHVTEPRSLESGTFPGVIVPRVRVGKDIDYTLDADQATGLQVQGNSVGTVDTLLIDAQGLADPSGTAQSSLEAVNYRKLGQHLLVHTGYESIPDLARLQDVQQRASSMLALRSSVWEEFAATPDGRRQLVQTTQNGIPVTGNWVKHLWEPGDGIRIAAARLGISDLIGRAMLGVSWQLRPGGIGRPQVTFRQRPRSNAETLRRLSRVALGAQRNYQGQLVTYTGEVGGTYKSAVDNYAFTEQSYSRVALPANVADIATATLVVTAKEDASTMKVELCNVDTGVPVTAPGHYDITAYLTRLADEQRIFVRLIGGTGRYELQLVLTVRA